MKILEITNCIKFAYIHYAGNKEMQEALRYALDLIEYANRKELEEENES